MPKKHRSNQQPARFLGTYTLPDGHSAVGELKLKGSSTLLKVHSSEFIAGVEAASCVKGTAYTGERLTLIDCHSPGSGRTNFRDRPTRFHADIFPHYVTVGQRHVEPADPCVSGVHFTTTDLATLFYDFDAFGAVIDAKPIIDVVLRERRQLRPVEVGERPQILYFTGRDCIVDVRTAMGRVSVHHRPRQSFGGPTGVYIENRIIVSIEPHELVTINDAAGRMYDVACFLSMAAGRAQGIDHIHVTTTDVSGTGTQVLAVHPSHRWKVSDRGEECRPHPADVPLDPIRHRAEFEVVLADWVGRQSSWGVARWRYLECIRGSNEYGPERLVAAANMFDILPVDAVPLSAKLPDDFAATRDECVAKFEKYARGIDRDRAISELKRLGRPSLPKKVAHRVSIVDSRLGARFPDLQIVGRVAVKCRDFFVHGNSDEIDYPKLHGLVPFLTDALEFIFAASDFIEAGWDPDRWNSDAHGWGHGFARFRSHYESALADLRRAIAN